ncbi:hypothetical protein BWQ96_04008 [Gracilariopsis chorda]|uniref:AMP-activated protein kinase glycogen-binding domain-containing protein n=1 Tax=Gracilariopsis chorda TaxID=448386 RepID=A0A2V3IVW5_9FLOR|nr:hypothetical protein BWQ96_04008 [Gracilariopsis chorda]|eukprot:PXF46223.1 hypothetical protein BWQ96_04008 [Gracilariopsis chorda]
MHPPPPQPTLHLRHSIAPRVLDNSVPMSTVVSTSRFSVRVAPPQTAPPPSSPSKLLTTFIWRDSGARVLLAGSFDDWRKHEMTFVPSIGYHVLVVELPPGSYEYRFVVDGRWRVADGDPNLRQDQFGELSHHLTIDADIAANAPPKRFSTASVTAAHPSLTEHAALHDGESDTDPELDEPDSEHEHHHSDMSEPEPEPAPAPRHRDSAYIKDYDDDACGELDLQADVFEAIKDVAESNPQTQPEPSHSTIVAESRPRHRFRRPGKRTLRKLWALLFGDLREQENVDPEQNQPPPVTRNQKLHGMADRSSRGLKVWFPNEKKTPRVVKGRKVHPSETKHVIDVEEKALRLHQVEENANTRQMLGKTLFAQGKYDAALALFSLSVKLREDNGLKYAKTTAIAHTDGTFSGGRAQLGDVYCFLGVVGDIKGDLYNAEACYCKAVDLYEQARATTDNPNYGTAIENLNANRKRQKQAPKQMRREIARIVGESVQPAEPPVRRPPKRVQVAHRPHPPPQPSAHPVKRTPPPPPQRPAHHDKRTPPAHRGPLEPARPPPAVTLDEESTLDSQALGYQPLQPVPPPQKQQPEVQPRRSSKRNSRPTTWKGLAETARQSMPKSPPDEDPSENEEDLEPPVGSYEEMCRTWHKDARKLMASGSYKEAIDMYTLAVYTRKRHGPWKTRENAETLVEHARALFATKQLDESVSALRDAIAISEELDQSKHGVFLGEVWGNLGSVLDRLGGRSHDALTAHCAGMVAYGKAGMSTDNAKWLKAWKSLCINLKMSGSTDRTNEIWQAIDLQIRGVTPMTKVGNVVLHR